MLILPPAPQLSTGRLLLAAPVPEDAQNIAEACASICRDHPYLLLPRTLEEAAFWIESDAAYAYALENLLLLGIRQRANHRLVGALSLQFELQHHRAELGFWIDPKQQGQGFGFEALGALMHWGFQGALLHKIYAVCASRNQAALSLLQKLNLRHEGYLRGHLWDGQENTDALQLSALASEWRYEP